jgi:Ca2+/Na+ antiporter
MSFTDRFVLWLHIGFAIFTIGPVAVAISSTPRYIRLRDVAILRYLSRITVIFTLGSLLVLIAGIVLAELKHDFSRPWLTVAMTLFVVAIVLLVLVIRDQRRAIKALSPAETSAHTSAHSPDQGSADGDSSAPAPSGPDPAGPEPSGTGTHGEAALAAHVASVERGRIAAMGGVVNLIWLVILVLMVWQP